jgi:tRNA(fMet)-specific endonuclease VapC
VTLYLFDTDQMSLYQTGHPRVLTNVVRHLADQLAVSVITVEEQLTGWQQALRSARDDPRRADVYQRMALTVENLAGWSILPFSLAAMSRHTGLVRQRLNVGSNDLKIAAIAMELQAVVVTRNLRDFGRVSGVVCEDWAQ